ncbi:MFS family permease [Halanaeroarchaeum sp. HSR-CO]|uniref:hypothetical protein n=1 Tax=Halanaeroarchaeum sp. HSR-CO TaxID=2866382 RepID=UPI0037C14688|nr:MFS family permease [Halanaeroarchaeum sp. HSR-CO]
MVSHAMVHTYELSIPILMTNWLDTFAVTAGQLGLVVSAGCALFGLGAFPGGVLADTVGSRRLVVALFWMGGQYVGSKSTERAPREVALAGAFGMLAVPAVVFLPTANAGLVPFIVVGAIPGFFLFVVQPLYQATVAEYSPAGTRGLSYGYTYLGVFGVGASAAAIAGGILEFFSAGVLFPFLAAIAVGGSVLATVLTIRKSDTPL